MTRQWKRSLRQRALGEYLPSDDCDKKSLAWASSRGVVAAYGGRCFCRGDVQTIMPYDATRGGIIATVIEGLAACAAGDVTERGVAATRPSDVRRFQGQGRRRSGSARLDAALASSAAVELEWWRAIGGATNGRLVLALDGREIAVLDGLSDPGAGAAAVWAPQPRARLVSP